MINTTKKSNSHIKFKQVDNRTELEINLLRLANKFNETYKLTKPNFNFSLNL